MRVLGGNGVVREDLEALMSAECVAVVGGRLVARVDEQVGQGRAEVRAAGVRNSEVECEVLIMVVIDSERGLLALGQVAYESCCRRRLAAAALAEYPDDHITRMFRIIIIYQQ